LPKAQVEVAVAVVLDGDVLEIRARISVRFSVCGGHVLFPSDRLAGVGPIGRPGIRPTV